LPFFGQKENQKLVRSEAVYRPDLHLCAAVWQLTGWLSTVCSCCSDNYQADVPCSPAGLQGDKLIFLIW
jgi:hypothetical protein